MTSHPVGTAGMRLVRVELDGEPLTRLSPLLEADRAQFARDFDPLAATHAIAAVYVGLMTQAKQAPAPRRVKSVIAQITKLLA